MILCEFAEKMRALPGPRISAAFLGIHTPRNAALILGLERLPGDFDNRH
jgi:hypothetical protein